jgi:hypothetical protein
MESTFQMKSLSFHQVHMLIFYDHNSKHDMFCKITSIRILTLRDKTPLILIQHGVLDIIGRNV